MAYGGMAASINFNFVRGKVRQFDTSHHRKEARKVKTFCISGSLSYIFLSQIKYLAIKKKKCTCLFLKE